MFNGSLSDRGSVVSDGDGSVQGRAILMQHGRHVFAPRVGMQQRYRLWRWKVSHVTVGVPGVMTSLLP